ncbi:MAG: PTS sugar transporter subunit IIC [Ruminococcaceae bacterium]|nr:PTS sugar transporter subunit IIC [Oscillospiraceae bacterium]
MKKLFDFCRKKGVVPSWKTYFIDAMSAMALGLFASLLMSTILDTLADFIFKNETADFLHTIAGYASGASGMAIGCAVAGALKAPPLVLASCAVVGSIGYSLPTLFTIGGAEKTLTAGPAGAFFAVLFACEMGKLVCKSTKVDILVTPSVTLLAGYGISALLCPGISFVMYYLGQFINYATDMQPILMGIIISVVVGIILTLPISSAAICAMIGITGIAGGAAAAGCCAQMVGFAVISYRENKFGGLVAQGLGTSMLQMGNICRNPRIWIPSILASAITGPLATTVFKLKCTGVSAGMGTCGLVGPIGIFSASGSGAMTIIGVILICVVFPAILSLLFSEILRKIGWIKAGDMKLEM